MQPRRAPYLPFLDGPSVVAPALKPIDEEKWLVPDPGREDWLARKQILMRSRPGDIIAGDVNSFAAHELLLTMEMTLGTVADPWITQALAASATLVSDDLCLMQRDSEGLWRLAAGVVAAPSYWSLPRAIGETLGGLHSAVPGGDPELARRISRVFDGLSGETVLERFNWTVQAEGAYFTPERPSAEGMAPDQLFLRVERQTLRRLPESGLICFSIRVCVDPLMPILADGDLREAFEDAWIGTDAELRAYKGWDVLEPLVREACRQSAGVY